MTRSPIQDYDAAVTLARTGNFRAAARELGMSPSALSTAIAALEARLDVRLFHRTTRSTSLTEAGAEFLERITPALVEIRHAEDAVNAHRETPRGTLRINTSLGAAEQLMRPLIREYLRRYPDMKIELFTEVRLVDIVSEGFDAGIRLAESVPLDMISVPLGPEQRMIVVGSPDYFRHHPKPKSPADLKNHPCIRYRMANGSIWHWDFERRGEAIVLEVDGPITLNEAGLMMDATLDGMGLGYLSLHNIGEHLASGRLVQVLEDWTPPFPGLCLYYPGRKHVPAGLRAMIDLVHEQRRALSQS